MPIRSAPRPILSNPTASLWILGIPASSLSGVGLGAVWPVAASAAISVDQPAEVDASRLPRPSLGRRVHPWRGPCGLTEYTFR